MAVTRNKYYFGPKIRIPLRGWPKEIYMNTARFTVASALPPAAGITTLKLRSSGDR